jgi:hypothetical protein
MEYPKRQGYTLLENGYVHTTSLKLSEANEMLERHKRFFPELEWDVVYDGPKEYQQNWA